MKRIPILGATGVLAAASLLYGQFGGIVFDPTQNTNALKQLANDIAKLQRLDATILNLTAQYNQMVNNARYFPSSIRNTWAGVGNRIVTNWTSPDYYGETAAWNPAVLLGTGGSLAWRNATIALQRDVYMVGHPLGTSRNMAYVASVNTFDGAGPAALQTIGNNRRQQAQMDISIAQLRAAAADGSAGMNSEVQQLNLLNAGTVQTLQMQQATNNALTAMLEQQSIANKLQRDSLADHMNFLNQVDQYTVSEPYAWGNAAQAISNYRMKQ